MKIGNHVKILSIGEATGYIKEVCGDKYIVALETADERTLVCVREELHIIRDKEEA